MPKRDAGFALLLAALCGAFPLAAVGAPAAWQEDLRRCMIYLPIEHGRVAIAYDEDILEIDVQRDDDWRERAATTYVVTFDDRAPIETKPPETRGILDHVLGPYATIAPIFAKTKTMKIAMTPPDKPTEVLTIKIGNGAKAMAFLKKCKEYYERKRRKNHR